MTLFFVLISDLYNIYNKAIGQRVSSNKTEIAVKTTNHYIFDAYILVEIM